MDRKAAVTLFPYQLKWLRDQSRFKIGLKSRQIGFTLFCGTLEAVLDALKTGETWYYLSAGERQSKAAIEDVKTHCEAQKAAVETIEEDVEFEDRKWKHLEVQLPGGGKVIGLPANPHTVRGLRGNVVFDEFAFHQNGRDIWRAMFPVIAHGWKVRILSTPNGRQGKFHEIWEHGSNKMWSRHKVDIYEAVKQGLPLNIEELREGLGNEDDWMQEFCCVFLDSALAWIAFDLIDAADDSKATLELPGPWKPQGPLYLGVDIGRKRDLTVLWLMELIGDVRWTRAVIVLEKTRFRDQIGMINTFMPLVRRACVDATGMGMQLAEELEEKWGSKVEGITFTSQSKEALATQLRKQFEDHRLRIPYDLEVRRDIHSVKRIVTPAGNYRFDADRSDAGHADRFWALALAENAVGQAEVAPTVDVIERSRSTGLYDQFGGFGSFEDDADEAFDDGAWLELG